jgi:hypothetical protein
MTRLLGSLAFAVTGVMRDADRLPGPAHNRWPHASGDQLSRPLAARAGSPTARRDRPLVMTSRRALELCGRLLNEATTGFLALVALGIALAPLALPLSPSVTSVLNTAEWVIVGLFALDYLINLLLSPRPAA